MSQVYRWEFRSEEGEIPVPAPIAGQGYSLVFNDEFEGTELNTDEWSPKEFWESEPPAGAVVVANSIVTIKNFGPWNEPVSIYDQSIAQGPYWGPGPVKRYFRYGYFEARMRFSAGKGSFPAFWLLCRDNAENGYPNCAGRIDLSYELDIMEYQGEPGQADTFYGTIHRNTGDICGTNDSIEHVVTEPAGSGVSLANVWHTYACNWKIDTVTWYVDDVQQGTPQTNFDSGDQDMFIGITMQAGGWDEYNDVEYGVTPDPLVTECDWVRVWQQ